jgi:hypothetical protein
VGEAGVGMLRSRVSTVIRSPRRVARASSLGEISGSAVASASVRPAYGTLSLNPFGLDIVLWDPGSLTVGATVPLILRFRHADQVTVDATATPPGTP